MPRTVNHEIRRTDLVRAFWRLVERDGVEKATMRTIATEAGVSLGMLQHYFADKDEILGVAIRDSQEVYRTKTARQIGALGDAPDPRAVVELVLRGRLPLTAKQQRQAWVLLHWFRGAASTEVSLALLAESERFVGATLRAALQDARGQGTLVPDLDAGAAAELLVALTDGLLLSLLFGRFGKAHALRLLDAQLDVLLPA